MLEASSSSSDAPLNHETSDAGSDHIAVPATAAIPAPAVPELVPVRMLNEYAYCPRLSYLEWVQGEWAENLETMEGSFSHRNVDKPSTGHVPEGQSQDASDSSSESDKSDKSDPHAVSLHARSITLSSARLGLIAKLDLLELEGNQATPVDYKRGSIPKIPEGAYEPERVQVCAQGLLLREAGFQSDEGVIYYVKSRKRVTIPFDEALIGRTLELLAEMKATAANGKLPPPLVDSPKCPRCSLVGICLPDETNLLIQPSLPDDDDIADEVTATTDSISVREAKRPRKLLPSLSHALPLYVQESFASVGKDGDCLVVKKERETVARAKLLDVSQVCLFGNAQLSSQALRELATRGIPICHFSYGGWFHAITAGLIHKNVELRIAQFVAAADPQTSLRLARSFVVGKIRNARTLLRRHMQPPDQRLLSRLSMFAEQANQAKSAATLLGIEGTAAKEYFAGFNTILKGGFTFDMEGRNRRPPRDPINALLSFVYALLVKEITITLQAVGFDPMCGVYHQPRYGRPSLALDFAEEFRPLLGDSVVLTLVNNGEVSESSFICRAGEVALTTAGRRAVIAAYERRLATEVIHPIFQYRASYRRILEVQVRLLSRTLLGEIEAYPNFRTR